MSELGEYYQELRAKSQSKKEKNRDWNTQVIDGLSVEFNFNVEKFTEFHFGLFHPKNGRLDYYPSTGKARWTKDVYKKTFRIPDIEAYLRKHFTPKTSTDE